MLLIARLFPLPYFDSILYSSSFLLRRKSTMARIALTATETNLPRASRLRVSFSVSRYSIDGLRFLMGSCRARFNIDERGRVRAKKRIPYVGGASRALGIWRNFSFRGPFAGESLLLNGDPYYSILGHRAIVGEE